MLHGIGLSISDAEIFDEEYALHLIEWSERLDATWMSEHLSFSRVGTGHEVSVVLPGPVPYHQEALDLLDAARQVFGRSIEPFVPARE